MEGGSFLTLLYEVEAKGVTLSEDFCKYSLYMACKALNELHRKNIIFGDFNPEHMLMKPNGDIKLENFSNSSIITQPKSNSSLRFLAPEVIQDMQLAETKQDVWSLGMFAIVLGSIKKPYADVMDEELACLSVLNNDPPSLPDSAAYSLVYRDFISKCL